MIKIGVTSLGCPRAAADFEASLGRLAKDRYQITQQPKSADVIILNTCGFIEAAKRESLEAIFHAVRQKQNGRGRFIIVMGCLSQRYGQQLREQIPEIDAVVGADDYDHLALILKELKDGQSTLRVRPNPRYLPDASGRRFMLGSTHSAYVKISDGCINRCSYCAIPMIRGGHRFRTVSSIGAEIERLSERYRLAEVILVGQDTTAYGYDRRKLFRLPDLITRIARMNLIPWIRILYAHPAHVTDELMEVMGKTRAVCRYIDLPIEHSHDAILSKMNRRANRALIEQVIERFRRLVPGLAIRTSVMVGFPGETPKHFQDLLDFVRKMRFDRLGVFQYSREEGTAAYRFRPQIPERLKAQRAEQLMLAQMQISKQRHAGFIGKKLKVLVDAKRSQSGYVARTEFDAPEIDGVVYLTSGELLKPGDFVCARIKRSNEYDLFGEVTHESCE